MRLADYRDEEGSVARLGGVRDAFNSPFRPFVLATTSVGQEGLDFHPYCYRVYHWNLPGNPVDLEQREGRVHRFKGHAVRLNVAHNHGDELWGEGGDIDPWAQMFASARAATTADTDLAPYWLCEGPVKVERRVPILPFSRETPAPRVAETKPHRLSAGVRPAPPRRPFGLSRRAAGTGHNDGRAGGAADQVAAVRPTQKISEIHLPDRFCRVHGLG